VLLAGVSESSSSYPLRAFVLVSTVFNPERVSMSMCELRLCRLLLAVALPIALSQASCADQRAAESAPPPAQGSTELVKVPAGPVTTGFAIGHLRKTVTVDTFSISRFPVTRADYEKCVRAGACEANPRLCSARALESFGRVAPEADDSPLACTPFAQAARYCAWVGGRLPTLSQWQLAARGSEPHRYPWGETQPSCAEHPRAAERPIAADRVVPDSGQNCLSAAERQLSVALHSAGASPYGVEDVLLLPGELLATEPGTRFPACRPGGRACVVYGLQPGSIDSVMALSEKPGRTPGSEIAYGFRCVVDEG
jgi:formylglycine-generating enzyme required for sulfatase activity